ncbi:alpha/beta hydrolase, partial [bacterium]|nr:alpha/beta hydrolase [bacterium]
MRTLSILAGLLLLLAVNTQAQDTNLNEIPCFFEMPEWAEADGSILCGYVTLPEDPQQPNGAMIRLPVTVFPSTAVSPEPEPLVLNTGGPASSGMNSVGQLAFTPFGDAIRAERDIVVIEQRGTRYADTPLFCQPLADLVFETAGGQVDNTAYREALAPCVEDWREEQGVKLETYTTATLAADIVSIVEALGYDQFTYYGVSYGTITGQVLMSDYPEHLHSVILDSSGPLSINFWLPVSQNIERALTAIVTACQADTFCNESYPNVAEDFFSTLERLNDNPLTLNLVDDETGETTTVTFNGDDYGALIAGMLYSELS